VSQEPEHIPKQFFTIGEVARELNLSTSLIRFWESEFREITPRKNRKGNRVYTLKDIEAIRKIHYLLKVRKYTISGARDWLRQEQKNAEEPHQAKNTLLKLRAFLEELKECL
jgi:DNA-binding transcriptional MerR regulator